MPAPGDQHSYVSNPFEEAKPRISEFTAKEIATLQSRLERQLGPEYLSTRAGPGGTKLNYVPGDKVIGLANEVFGFNGWSSSIQNIQVDFIDEHPQTGKISLGLSVIVRVTLKDGTFHEDIGYGQIENCKSKAAAFEKAKKEGTTDALKRAMRSFGNLLGLCVYDKDYLAKVGKMKVEPAKFDEANLYRHQGFVNKLPVIPPSVKQETSNAVPTVAQQPQPNFPDSFDDLLGCEDFDEADFCIVDPDSHPDEVAMPDVSQNSNSGSSTGRESLGANGASAPPANNNNQRPMQPGSMGRVTHTSNAPPQRPGPPNGANNHQQGYNLGPRPQPHGNNQNRPQQQRAANNNSIPQRHETPPRPQQTAAAGPVAAAPPTGNEPVSFFSARAVPRLAEDAAPTPAGMATPAILFNPKAESPSIRKTPGIDHTTSRPVSKTGQHVDPATKNPDGTTVNDKPGVQGGGPQQQAQRGSVLNPSFEGPRRIGAPGGMASPLANRNQYKPPTMKRPPLADVSNGTSMATGREGDVKRVKLN